MRLPNFLIVGAAKSGTTALHHYLDQHPQIFMTPEKETNFFAFEGETLNFQGPGDQAINSFSITSLDTYVNEFRTVSHEVAIGEACPLYLYHPSAPQRIRSHISEAKLIVILRNPVDRAYANYLHLVRDGRESESDFSKALDAESHRIDANWEWFWHYIQQGYYGLQLQRYCDQFPSSQIKIFLYEDLVQAPQSLLQNIFQFLEIDPTFEPDMSLRPNKSGHPKNKVLHNLLTRPNPLKSVLKPLFPQQLRQAIQHRNLGKSPLSAEVRQSLINLYREDILHCQELIQRDLSAWLEIAHQPALVTSS